MEQFIWALGLSLHMGLEDSYNGIHPHVRFYEDGAIAGAYYNSLENISFYGGYRLEHGDAGVEVALVTGYPSFGPISPQVRGTYDFSDNVRAFASPAIETNNTGVVIGLEFQFK